MIARISYHLHHLTSSFQAAIKHFSKRLHTMALKVEAAVFGAGHFQRLGKEKLKSRNLNFLPEKTFKALSIGDFSSGHITSLDRAHLNFLVQERSIREGGKSIKARTARLRNGRGEGTFATLKLGTSKRSTQA